jgi:hypothetical protein
MGFFNLHPRTGRISRIDEALGLSEQGETTVRLGLKPEE